MEELKRKIEALLFVVSEGMKVKELAEKTGAPESDVQKALDELRIDYSNGKRAFNLLNYNDLYRMSVERGLVSGLNELVPREFSNSLIKTLSVIAWKNGITQGEVVKIRGNKAYEHINKLKELDFIALEEYGKTYKLMLSAKFYEYFNISKGQEKFIFGEGEDE